MKTQIATALAAGNAKDAATKLAAEVKGKLAGQAPVLVLAFASTAQPIGELTEHLAPHFPGAVLLSASTAGEFTEKGDAKSSVSLFALAGDYKIFAGIG